MAPMKWDKLIASTPPTPTNKFLLKFAIAITHPKKGAHLKAFHDKHGGRNQEKNESTSWGTTCPIESIRE
jgi:hypothetical protein